MFNDSFKEKNIYYKSKKNINTYKVGIEIDYHRLGLVFKKYAFNYLALNSVIKIHDYKIML